MAMTYGSIDKSNETYYVTFLWGKMHEDTPKVYKFKTEGERNAFINGANAGCGWDSFDYKEHNKPKTFKLSDFDNYTGEE